MSIERGPSPEEMGINPEVVDDSTSDSTSAKSEMEQPESETSLEEQEQTLKAELAGEVSNLEENTNRLEELAQDPEATPALRDRLLNSVDMITRRIYDKLANRIGGATAIGTLAATNEFFINSGQSVVMKGSILGYVNEAVLAALAVYTTVKGLQLAGHKIKELSIKHGINKGTVGGAANAASYITMEGSDVGLKTDLGLSSEDRDDILPVTAREHSALYKEHSDIFDEENVYPPEYIESKEEHTRWEKAMHRIRVEASEALTA